MFKNANTIKTITLALRRCSDKVVLNRTWQHLHQRYGVGSLTGSRLELSEHDHQHLRRLLDHHLNYDPLKHTPADIEADRMARTWMRNEKAGGGTVSEGLVMLGSATGELHLPSGTYRLPQGSTLNIPGEALTGAERVVLIENLPVMYALHRYDWPPGLAELPMLFRGSPQFSPAAVTQALSGVREVICFPDYDPQGLFNSLTQAKATALVLPTESAINQLVAERRDKPDDFEHQQTAREWLATRQLSPVKRLLDRRLAVSQESMAGLALEMVALSEILG